MKDRTEPGELLLYLKALLKPGIGKIVVFLFLLFVLMLLPLYPVQVSNYEGHSIDDIDEFQYSRTRLSSLIIVLQGDYNWTEMEVTTMIYSSSVSIDTYHMSYYDANPLYVLVYVFLSALAYYVSCYYIETNKHAKKT